MLITGAHRVALTTFQISRIGSNGRAESLLATAMTSSPFAACSMAASSVAFPNETADTFVSFARWRSKLLYTFEAGQDISHAPCNNLRIKFWDIFHALPKCPVDFFHHRILIYISP